MELAGKWKESVIEVKAKLQNCDQHTGEMMVDYAYGELSPSLRRNFESHLTQCQECRSALSKISETRKTMAAIEPELAPDAGLESLLAYAEQAAARNRADSEIGLERVGNGYSGAFSQPRQSRAAPSPAAEKDQVDLQSERASEAGRWRRRFFAWLAPLTLAGSAAAVLFLVVGHRVGVSGIDPSRQPGEIAKSPEFEPIARKSPGTYASEDSERGEAEKSSSGRIEKSAPEKSTESKPGRSSGSSDLGKGLLAFNGPSAKPKEEQRTVSPAEPAPRNSSTMRDERDALAERSLNKLAPASKAARKVDASGGIADRDDRSNRSADRSLNQPVAPAASPSVAIANSDSAAAPGSTFGAGKDRATPISSSKKERAQSHAPIQTAAEQAEEIAVAKSDVRSSPVVRDEREAFESQSANGAGSAVASNSSATSAQLAMAKSAASRGAHREAVDILSRLVLVPPSGVDTATVLFLLAKEQALSGEMKEAVDTYAKFLASYPSDERAPQVAEARAQLFERMNLHSQAAAARAFLEEHFPNSVEAKKQRARSVPASEPRLSRPRENTGGR